MTVEAAPTQFRMDPDYEQMLKTLSEGSVHVHFDPYEDIAWDSPELAIDPNDPRWIIPANLIRSARPPGTRRCRSTARSSSAGGASRTRSRSAAPSRASSSAGSCSTR